MKHTIMAVDDVLINLMVLESILEEDYNFISITSAEEALEQMKEDKPDLILLDLYMPGMDGFELIENMNKDEGLRSIPVIFVTGERDAYSEEKGLALGAVDYIKKPYVPGVIRIKIKNHIELKTYRDSLSDAVKERTRLLEEKTNELSATHDAIIMGMSLLSESRDEVTGSHLARIKVLTQLLANKVAKDNPDMLNEEMIEIISTYSPLHDVGKVSVTDAILRKTGSLTAEEFQKMKAHTSGGGDLLRQVESFLPSGSSHLDIAIDIAENHHERFDGSGYPHGKKGDNIPLAARIVSVVDVYDALRSPRPYKPSFSHDEAVDIMLKGDGRTMPEHFDPVVLEAFRKIHPMLNEAYNRAADSEE
ncbi:MAG: response regulator [Defluviitaleaceae bacterium]|nr:response regulator [Defluviitaleaceae bacterium]